MTCSLTYGIVSGVCEWVELDVEELYLLESGIEGLMPGQSAEASIGERVDKGWKIGSFIHIETHVILERREAPSSSGRGH